MANLANRFLNAGFADEARAMLDTAMKLPDPHANVGTNLANVTKRIEDETEREKEILQKAVRGQTFLRAFSAAHHVDAPTPDLVGRWSWPARNAELTISQSEADFEANFRVGDSNARLTGHFNNRAMEVEYFVKEWTFRLNPPSERYVRKASGRGYLDSSKAIVLKLTDGDGEAETLHALKNDVNE